MNDFITIKNFSRYEINQKGEIYNKSTNFQLKGTLVKAGYIKVHIINDTTGKAQILFLHRLVAETFLENPNDYDEIDHIDNNKTNNNVENLRWCTRSQNATNRENYSRNKKGAPEKKFKFVSWEKRAKKWRGTIRINGKLKHIGMSDNDEEMYIMCLKVLNNIFKDNEFLSNQVQKDLKKYNII